MEMETMSEQRDTGKRFKAQEPSFPNKYQANGRCAYFVFENVITRSEKMMEIFRVISDILELDTTVFVYGETGTGKELLASVIHFNGPRKDKPFVTVNCASIPNELFESELFGHRKGAFTGANEDRKGLFQVAHGGTLLLDEIGEMPLKLQAKLLRVIEDKKVMSLGSDKSVDIDVRIIAATNRNLESEVEKGNFREDLFYRLNIVPIKLPPLRERREDIPLLARFFVKKYAEEFHKPVKSISETALGALIGYSWPGNVRELANVIERAVILERKETITDVEIPPTRKKGDPVSFTGNFREAKAKAIENFEKNYICGLLELYGGKLRQAARHADMDVKNFFEKMKKYEIKRDVFLE